MIRAAGVPRVLMAGGGTGGHLFPGVAVAEALQRRMPGATVKLAATAKDLVSPHLAACPFEIVQLGSPKLPAGAMHVPGFGVRMASAVVRSYSFLRESEPEIVIGLGGYGSVAPVTAARARRIPAILLEQNAVAGKATRLLSRLGAVVATSFAQTHGVARSMHTGNPLRERVLKTRIAHAEFGLDPNEPVVGVLGGSLGARGLNERFVAALPALVGAGAWPFQVIHATGGDDDARILKAYEAAGVRACVRPFFVEMDAVYGTIDAAVCRAGGTTVAELTALGRPAVFVPYPHHADQHQRRNAEALVRAEAASILDEAQATPDALAAVLTPLLKDRALRIAKARGMREMGRPDAADRVVDLILELTGYATSAEVPAVKEAHS